jgi:hypothetical protein
MAHEISLRKRIGSTWITVDLYRNRSTSTSCNEAGGVREGFDIPSVLIRDGADGGDVIKKWLQTRYHTPLDNMEQPINYDAGIKPARMVFLVGYDVAQQDQAPTWNKDGFFGNIFGSKRSGSPPKRIQPNPSTVHVSISCSPGATKSSFSLSDGETYC